MIREQSDNLVEMLWHHI